MGFCIGKMKIRKFQEKDIRQVAKLKNEVYSQFNSKEYFEKKAANKYIEHTSLKKSDKELLEAFTGKRTTIFYVAEENNKIIGMIRGRPGRISNLFVDGKQHKKGIGRRLVLKFEKEAKKQGSKEIKLRASLYATPFYEKMNYRKTTGIRNFGGLKVYPMKRELK